MEIVKKNFKWVVFALLLVALICIAWGVIAFKVLPIDTWALNLMINTVRTGWLTVIFKAITFFGEAKLLIAVAILGTIIGIVVFKDKERTLCFTGNLMLIAGINWVIKHIVQRPRPDESLRLVEESGFSFPSGHAMVTTAFYGLLIYFAYHHIENKLLRNVICIGLALLIVLIDFSRVYLGVHYLSDVLAGSLISIAYLIVAITIAEKYVFKD